MSTDTSSSSDNSNDSSDTPPPPASPSSNSDTTASSSSYQPESPDYSSEELICHELNCTCPTPDKAADKVYWQAVDYPTKGENNFTLRVDPADRPILGDGNFMLNGVRAEQYLRPLVGGNIGLTTNNKIWYVRLDQRGDQYILGEGWGSFVRDNDLKKNDMCVFKSGRSAAYTVKILRVKY